MIIAAVDCAGGQTQTAAASYYADKRRIPFLQIFAQVALTRHARGSECALVMDKVVFHIDSACSSNRYVDSVVMTGHYRPVR
jgi:hypothetical protein